MEKVSGARGAEGKPNNPDRSHTGGRERIRMQPLSERSAFSLEEVARAARYCDTKGLYTNLSMPEGVKDEEAPLDSNKRLTPPAAEFGLGSFAAAPPVTREPAPSGLALGSPAPPHALVASVDGRNRWRMASTL